jgi:hypothetical protein
MLQNSVLARKTFRTNLSTSSDFGQVSTQKTTHLNLSEYCGQKHYVSSYFKTLNDHNYKLKFDRFRFYRLKQFHKIDSRGGDDDGAGRSTYIPGDHVSSASRVGTRRALIRFFSCMSPLVGGQVVRSGKDLHKRNPF